MSTKLTFMGRDTELIYNKPGQTGDSRNVELERNIHS